MITNTKQIAEPIELDSEQFDEHLLITREYTHVDSSDYDDIHRLGYYWTIQAQAFTLVR